MKNDLFQSCDHYWVFQIRWHIECSTFTASSFRIWNNSTGIPLSPLALFVVMLPKAHLTSYSRMSGYRWVITPSLLSGSWRSFLYVAHSTLRKVDYLCGPDFVVPFKPGNRGQRKWEIWSLRRIWHKWDSPLLALKIKRATCQGMWVVPESWECPPAASHQGNRDLSPTSIGAEICQQTEMASEEEPKTPVRMQLTSTWISALWCSKQRPVS